MSNLQQCNTMTTGSSDNSQSVEISGHILAVLFMDSSVSSSFLLQIMKPSTIFCLARESCRPGMSLIRFADERHVDSSPQVALLSWDS